MWNFSKFLVLFAIVISTTLKYEYFYFYFFYYAIAISDHRCRTHMTLSTFDTFLNEFIHSSNNSFTNWVSLRIKESAVCHLNSSGKCEILTRKVKRHTARGTLKKLLENSKNVRDTTSNNQVHKYTKILCFMCGNSFVCKRA